MKAFALGYLVNSLWQTPLLLVAAWLVARATHRMGPAFEHRIWTSALMLEALLPACTFDPFTLLQSANSFIHHLLHIAEPHGTTITITIGSVSPRNAFDPPAKLFTALLVAYIVVTLYFCARLAWRARQSSVLRRRAQTLSLTTAAKASWQRCANLFQVPDAQLASTPAIAGPVTLGVVQRLLLLPSGWLETLSAEDLDAALAHEFAHMRRRDFAKNLFYELITLPIAYHPALWLTRARVAESRELLCDALAAEAVAGKQQYARSLLRLASKLCTPSQHPVLHAIGIFDANNLERRVMNLTHTTPPLRGLKRFAISAGCVVLALGTCTSALGLRIPIEESAPPDPPASVGEPAPAPPPVPAPIAERKPVPPPPPPSTPEAQPASAAPPAHVALAAPAPAAEAPVAPAPTDAPQADAQPMHISPATMASNITGKVAPVYPDEARAEKIQGTVVLHAIIEKDGKVSSLTVVSGPKELQVAALDAVRQWTYKPYLLNGNPTQVETTINVNFHIGGY